MSDQEKSHATAALRNGILVGIGCALLILFAALGLNALTEKCLTGETEVLGACWVRTAPEQCIAGNNTMDGEYSDFVQACGRGKVGILYTFGIFTWVFFILADLIVAAVSGWAAWLYFRRRKIVGKAEGRIDAKEGMEAALVFFSEQFEGGLIGTYEDAGEKQYRREGITPWSGFKPWYDGDKPYVEFDIVATSGKRPGIYSLKVYLDQGYENIIKGNCVRITNGPLADADFEDKKKPLAPVLDPLSKKLGELAKYRSEEEVEEIAADIAQRQLLEGAEGAEDINPEFVREAAEDARRTSPRRTRQTGGRQDSTAPRRTPEE